MNLKEEEPTEQLEVGEWNRGKQGRNKWHKGDEYDEWMS